MLSKGFENDGDDGEGVAKTCFCGASFFSKAKMLYVELVEEMRKKRRPYLYLL